MAKKPIFCDVRYSNDDAAFITLTVLDQDGDIQEIGKLEIHRFSKAYRILLTDENKDIIAVYEGLLDSNE